MKNYKIYTICTLCIVLCLLTTTGLYAQSPLDDILFETEMDDAGAAPIDGFIGIAMAIAAYFGVKKIRNKE